MSFIRLQSRLVLAAVLFVSALAGAAAAQADIGETIIQRCTHGQSLSGFSQSAYSQALKELSADAEEYTNCSSLIRQAQLTAAGGQGGAGAGENVVPLVATPAEQQAISHAAKAGAAPVRLGGELVRPGVVHANIASAVSALPSPLLATVAFMLACLLALLGGTAWNRLRGRRD